MPRSEDMNKITLFALSKQRELVISKIQQLGLMQSIDLKQSEIKDLQKPSDVPNLKEISDNLLRVSRIFHILKLPPKKLGFTENMLGLEFLDKKKIDRKDTMRILKESDSFLSKHEKVIIKLEDRHKEINELEEELSEFKLIASMFEFTNIPINQLESTDKLSIISGKVPLANISQLKHVLNKELKGYVHMTSKSINKKQALVVVIGLKEDTSNLNFLMKKFNVNILAIPKWAMRESPLVYIKSELSKLTREKKAIIKEISSHNTKIFHETVVLREELEVLKNRYETIHSMLDSDKFFVLQGWLLKSKTNKFNHELTSLLKGNVIINIEEAEGDNVPVHLSNHKFIRPFEYLTELYALPKYKDLDPTFIIGPLFLIFAAFMLTDAVYGMLLVFLGIFIYKKFAKYDDSMKSTSITILCMGSMTTFFGILTGSYFGDLPKHLFGVSSEQLAIWKDPLSDPLYFLIISIGVAVVYLNIGFILGLIEDYRKKDYKTMFKERIVWFMMQTGIALLALKINPVLLTIFGKSIGLATLIIIISVISIVITHGPLGLLSITGLMGDMISFSRLFALSLSTAGIALAVNLLANLVVGFPYVGIILAILIFIVGHLFGFVMNTIGSFVHSLRLQFVEFFGRFYEGGGDKFIPLTEDRLYTEVRGHSK